MTQEIERKRIARELHDTTVQNLTALAKKIEYCTYLVDKDPIETKLELQLMYGTIRSTIDEMRAVIYDLRPMEIDDLPIVSALQDLVIHVKNQYSITVSFDVTGDEPVLLPMIKLNAYRLFHEAVMNAVKHSKTDRIYTSLLFEEGSFTIRVNDAGCGFDPALVQKDSHFGLSIMRERAALIGGSMEVKSEVGNGTEVILELPYQWNESEG